MNFYGNPKLTKYAQKLRRNMTNEERHLWYDFQCVSMIFAIPSQNDNTFNDISLTRYDVLRCAQYDAARFTHNDAMFATNIRRSRHH